MPWARFEDRFPSNRKIRLLSDGAFRLYVSGICWSAENLTDGVIKTAELRLVADVKSPRKRAEELVKHGLWEVVPETGWRIHDYHEYQPTAAQVRAERKAKTARQQRWREKQKGGGVPPPPPDGRSDVDASTDTSRDTSKDAAPARAFPSRPDPTRVDGGSVGDGSTGDQSVGARAREREALRWLHTTYGLTDDEAAQVIKEVRARARTSIVNLPRYLKSMVEDRDGAIKNDLVDIIEAVMRPAPKPVPEWTEPAKPARPPWCGECDRTTRMTGDPDRPSRCPKCKPRAIQEPA